MKSSARKNRSSPPERSSRGTRIRFHPVRQAVLALIALTAVGGSYLAASYFSGGGEAPKTSEKAVAPRAWYADQPPPPAVVTAQDQPILHEGHEQSDAPVAYEEALPQEVFVTAPPPPMPPSAPQAVAEPKAATAETQVAAVPVVPNSEKVPMWVMNAVAPPPVDGRAMVAIVIDDLGMDRRRTRDVTELPGPLTLSFLTYADDLPNQTASARKAGHELMLHVAMEPGSKTVDPGRNVLLTTLGADENRRRLDWGLNRFAGYVGINNHMGSKFTADPKAMAVVMKDLAARGLLFLDSRTGPKTVGRSVAERFGVPVVERNIFLDNVNEVPAVLDRLAEVERIARRTGFAIAIGHPRDATIEALSGWLPALNGMGLVLVPVSAIAAKHLGAMRLAGEPRKKGTP